MKRKSERGFTLIELLIVVAILGVLAAVVIPNVGRFLGRGQEEARRAEFHDVGTAVTALMVENNLASIPNPVVDDGAGPCAANAGTQLLDAFPDATATLASKATQLGGTWALGDKVGYLLYSHDIVGSASAANLVNYVNFKKSTYCYTVESNGTVHQFKTDGVEQTT